jgi:nucleoside-diphosphate-sugar epimerase
MRNVSLVRVLLAGAAGAVGRYLVPQLCEAGHEVIGITRRAGSLAGTGAREIVADVLDRAALFAAFDGVRADAVIHQATALKKAPMTHRHLRETNRLRGEGTSTLLALARRVGAKKFIAASAFYGYGFRDFGRVPLDETAAFGEPDGHNDAVIIALASLEQQVHAFGGISLRNGLLYDGLPATVSPVARRWTGVLPMLHRSDAARAVVLALANGRPRQSYNIADEAPLSYRRRELARATAAGLRAPMQIPDVLLRILAPFGSELLTRTSVRLSTVKAAEQLGWAPQYPSLSEALGTVPVASPLAAPAIVASSVGRAA